MPTPPMPPSGPSPSGSGSDSSSMPSPPSPSSSSSSGESGDSGETGEAGKEGDAAQAEDWEEEGESTEGGEGGDGEASFEDVGSEEENGGLEEPNFEDSEGLSQEELEELEKELNESLGDFDEQMQREQTYAEERANDNAAESNIGGIGTFDSYEPNSENSFFLGLNLLQARVPAIRVNPTLPQVGQVVIVRLENLVHRGEGEGSNPISGEVEEQVDEGEDIPSPQGDDIVARQIREAAENEKDPALRKKLWEEYRRYKNQ